MKLGLTAAFIGASLVGEAQARNDRPGAIREHYDVVELNHYYDEKAKHIFDQILYKNFCDTTCGFRVQAWRIMKDNEAMIPHKRPDGTYEATFHDAGRLRKIESTSFEESWTQYDKELIDRDILPKEQRQDLLVPYDPSQSPSASPAPPSPRTNSTENTGE